MRRHRVRAHYMRRGQNQPLTEQQVRRALRMSSSKREAADFLGCSREHLNVLCRQFSIRVERDPSDDASYRSYCATPKCMRSPLPQIGLCIPCASAARKAMQL